MDWLRNDTYETQFEAMKSTLFDTDDLAKLSPIFRGNKGRFLAEVVMSFLALNLINRVFSKVCHLRGAEFTSAWLNELNVKYTIENESILDRLPKGSFVTVSNHPFGFIDGIILMDIIIPKRPDYKFMVNSLLMSLYPLGDNLIGVKPTTTKSGSSIENGKGLKMTLRHLQSGGSMGFFPAGAVSNYNEYRLKVTDREWQDTVVRMIQMAKVPVIPLFISGRNSLFFHFLGRINWQLRSIRFPYEILNKHRQKIRIVVGEPILVEEQQRFQNAAELAAYLRAQTNALGDRI
ncbi:MAG: lysophospholipid acyltransferase family protein [Bacteroidales bacterium]